MWNIIERAFLVSKMSITRLNSSSATLLIQLSKILVSLYMDFVCTDQIALKYHKNINLKYIIHNRCLCYAIVQ